MQESSPAGNPSQKKFVACGVKKDMKFREKIGDCREKMDDVNGTAERYVTSMAWIPLSVG